MLKRLASTVFCLALLATAANAATPSTIDYQGFLKSGGNPLTGTVSITFTIYNASSGGTSKWSETQSNVTVTGGLFNVTLGSVTAIPDSVFNQPDRWLAITIGGSELTPRTKIAASAYAMRVQTVDMAAGGTIAGDLVAARGSFGAANANGGAYAFAAGYGNTSSADYSSVTGGYSNTSSGTYSVVSGGRECTASGDRSSVLGGYQNGASNQYATVAGGYSNSASGLASTVGGGQSNWAAYQDAVVAGGTHNSARWYHSTVGGGYYNVAYSWGSTVAGGDHNTADGNFLGTVGGGTTNHAGAYGSTIPGGGHNDALGNWAFAAGYAAKANHDYAFVLSSPSATGDSMASGGPSQIVLRADSGLYITRTGGQAPYVTSRLINTSSGAYLTVGGVWTNASDRNKKENLAPVNRNDLLSKLDRLPITSWNYIADGSGVKHIGPMAQDFYALFKLGDDDKTISTIDPAGIALAAIQELYRAQQKLEQKVAEVDELRAQLAQLKTAVSEVLARANSSGSSNDLASVQSAAVHTSSVR